MKRKVLQLNDAAVIRKVEQVAVKHGRTKPDMAHRMLQFALPHFQDNDPLLTKQGAAPDQTPAA